MSHHEDGAVGVTYDPEPHLDHVAEEDRRHRQDQRHPEPAPEHRGVVHERLLTAVALVRVRYTAALPDVLTQSVVLRPLRRLYSALPPAVLRLKAPTQSLTLANSVVTYIQYECYFGIQHET